MLLGGNNTIYNLQFTIYNLQFTIYNLQFAICKVPSQICNWQFLIAICNYNLLISYTQWAIFKFQFSIFYRLMPLQLIHNPRPDIWRNGRASDSRLSVSIFIHWCLRIKMSILTIGLYYHLEN